ncbi:MAG: GSCFA domain-containing protein [Pseudomonadota bacterium]
MGERIPYEEVSRTAKANAESRLAKRGEPGNRMEPECWPALRPSFSFDRETGVFVIGSCFATNVERYLGDRGYRMLSATTGTELSSGSLNKYTPASVLEAVSWARAIYDRDDVMTEADAELCFFRLKDGRVVDTQLHAHEPADHAQALARRAEVYSIYRRLFSADLVIITLGLIEAWFDNVAERYIVETPNRWMIREKGRYLFERLDYDQCYSFMRQTMALIRGEGAGPQFLLTTSPVVLTRTFTSDDVIVANMYSKSVLRAVAGRLVEEDPSIDYFPSFESVMLTRNNAVWRDDLIHVAEPFIRQIMTRVERTYTNNVEDGFAEEIDLISRFVNAMGAHDYAEAGKLYHDFKDPLGVASIEFHSLASVMMMRQGNTTSARAHLEQPMLEGVAQTIAATHTPLRLWVWAWLDGADGAAQAITRLRAANALGFNRLWRCARWLVAEEELAAAADLLELVEPAAISREPMLRQMLRILDGQERRDASARLRRAWIETRPQDSHIGDRLQVASTAARSLITSPSGSSTDPNPAHAEPDEAPPAPEKPNAAQPLTADLVVRRGMALIKRGEPEQARRVARRFLRTAARSSEALFAAAVIEETLGDGDTASDLRAEAQRRLRAQARPQAKPKATAAAQ